MGESEQRLKHAAMEFVEAAKASAQDARAQAEADPLDEVSVEVIDLGDIDPVLDDEGLDELRDRLRRDRLLPDAVNELAGMARRIAGILAAR